MSRFTEPLAYEATEIFRGGRTRTLFVDGEAAIELVGARRLIRLTRAFAYDCPRTGRRFEVPVGFECDLGSIPGFARWALSPDDPWAQAYVLHDWLYRTGVVDRATADLILWDALGLPFRAYREGKPEPLRIVCPALYRSLIYRSVRLGGAAAYRPAGLILI